MDELVIEATNILIFWEKWLKNSTRCIQNRELYQYIHVIIRLITILAIDKNMRLDFILGVQQVQQCYMRCFGHLVGGDLDRSSVGLGIEERMWHIWQGDDIQYLVETDQ
jgi:hypothetical protein